MSVRYHFYTTSGCHLCDDARTIFQSLIQSAEITEIEIAESDALIKKYGVRIPVLKRLDNNREIDWPFDADELDHFLV